MRKEKEPQFNSPSRGRLSFTEVIYSLVDFMEEEPKKKYRLIIGTDSRSNGYNGTNQKTVSRANYNDIDFVTAIVVHRLGRGGRYFWLKENKQNIHTLRQKIYEETNLSLSLAQKLLNFLNQYLENERTGPAVKTPKYELEIHIDIGQAGPTRDMIKEIVGMVNGFGFFAKTKPEAYGATKVADKHT